MTSTAEQWFTVGKIVNTHGVRGELKIVSHTDFPGERFAPGSELTLRNPEQTQSVQAVVASSRPLKSGVYLLKFKDWDDINEVERYKGWLLKISQDRLFELADDEYYHHEIIGCEVVTEDGEPLGTIAEILSPGANDVWVVRPRKGKPIYLPYIDDVVKHVDTARKKVTVQLLEGLL